MDRGAIHDNFLPPPVIIALSFDNKVLDVAVVGGGPIGIETAVSLRQAGLDAGILEAGPVGHTISWWAPGTRWFSSNDRIAICGVPLHTVDQSKASREEYLAYLRGVVDQFDVPVQSFTRVRDIEPAGEHWQLSTVGVRPEAGMPERLASGGAESTVTARAVVLAIGGTDLPAKLNVPGEGLPHVDGYLREVHRYHGRRVLIVGGRNSAVEAAIRLYRGGAKVVLSYHRDELPSDSIKYWLRPEINGLIRSGAVQAHFGSRVESIHPDHVVLRTGEESAAIPVDDVLTLVGYRQDSTLWDRLELPRSGPAARPDFDAATMQTSRRGIYVAGTAIGGTQSSKYQVFVENCHTHAGKIAADLCNRLNCQSGDHGVGHDADQTLAARVKLQPES